MSFAKWQDKKLKNKKDNYKKIIKKDNYNVQLQKLGTEPIYELQW